MLDFACGRREWLCLFALSLLAIVSLTTLSGGGGGGGGPISPSAASSADPSSLTDESPAKPTPNEFLAARQQPLNASASSSMVLPAASTEAHRPFRFHVYKLPRQYVEGAIELLDTMWPVSICNRGKRKTNYTMLDWRHAHSLFTADVYITRYLRLHPQHTDDPAEADVFIIPMMTHLYNCIGRMGYMLDIVNHVYERYARHYREMDHRDHYLFWWRWGMHFGGVNKFWKRVARHFPNLNLISFDLLESMGRNHFQDFSLALKPRFERNVMNIIMPYPDLSPQLSKDVAAPPAEHEAEVQARPRRFLFYFAGTSTIGGVRRWIKWNCDTHNKRKPVVPIVSDNNEGSNSSNSGGASVAHVSSAYRDTDCVYVDFASTVVDTKRLGVPTDYPSAMLDSVFCGHAAGDALSSRRPTSAVLAGCIPVLICDLCLYAWESSLDYAAFAVFVPESEVIAGNLMRILKRVAANATRMRLLRRNLARVRPHFVYHHGAPVSGDALDMLVRELRVRGALTRQYRRWFRANTHLSSDARDYPADPPAVMRYVRRKPDGTVEKDDTEHSVNQPWPRQHLPVE